MEAPQNFRTAINGFRREDVVRYLEYLNAKHTAEVNQLSAETDSLNKELDSLRQELEACRTAPAADPALQETLDAALAEKAALESQVHELQDQLTAPAESLQDSGELEALRAENASLKNQIQALETASATPRDSDRSLAEQELEAYRRAERAERVAQEKADLIYHRANAILGEASQKIDGSSAELSELADHLNAQLQQMQYSINAGKLALKNAVDTLHTLHAEND